MSSPIDDFLISLVGAKDWNRQLARIKIWAEGGRTDDLLAVSAALTDDAQTPSFEPSARRGVLDSLERTLALTPGFAQAVAAVSVLQLREAYKTREAMRGPAPRQPSRRQHETELASLLAQGQTPLTLAALFETHGSKPAHLELLACLVQEMVLRGVSVSGPASEFWTRIAGTHPLGGLPLTLLPSESQFPKFLPNYGPQTKTYGSPGQRGEVVKPLPSRIEMSIAWTELEVSAAEKAAIEAATANWELESNGKGEVRVFRSDRVVPPPALTDKQVLSLPLESLAGASARDLWLIPYSVADAVAVLFCAACTGGADSLGLGGTYGRWAAWEATGALAGAGRNPSVGRNASFEDTAAIVGECAWWFWAAKSAWFYDVAWDIGLLALRPDGRTLAVLAATDTD